MTPANAARGETTLQVGARTARLCLTLGALAEIETALGDAEPLADRLRSLSARDIIIVVLALARGADDPLTDEELAHSDVTLAEAARAIAATFDAAVGR